MLRHALTLIFLAGLTGLVHASEGPIRTWHSAQVNGRTVQLWGYPDGNGFIRHDYADNPHVYATATPRPTPQLFPGQTISADGAINNGLNLHATQPTGTLETNDPNLAATLDANCPTDDGSDPIGFPRRPAFSLSLEEVAVPLTCLVCGIVLVIFAQAINRRQA